MSMDTTLPPHGMADPKSAVGKFPAPEQMVDVLVVGAGPAGLAAALEAARSGASVLLVDEHPVPVGLAGLDVPYLFGGRAGAALANPARMVERIAAATPGLAEAYDAGVEVLLGVSAWGAWVERPGLAVLPCRVAGLSDGSRSWMCGFRRLVVAAGARDLVLSFRDADQPGVMGARGLAALLTRYDAFDGREIVILGTGRLALDTALLALDRGIAVPALVEAAAAPVGPAPLVEAVRSRGVEILCGHVPLAAVASPAGVAGLDVVPVAGGPARRLDCDTVCLAIGLVPAVELLDVAGARLVMDAARGGYVPVLDDAGRSTAPGVVAAGDCAGIADDPGLDYRMGWMRALLATGGADAPACLCEEVTRADVFALNPPRYLGPPPPAMAARDYAALLRDGPPDHDQMKRLTRVSMGPCQARRCREQVAMLMAIGAGLPAASIGLAGYRAPVRPLPLSALAGGGDDEAGWDVWFGILSQWVPYAAIGTEREDAWRAGSMHL